MDKRKKKQSRYILIALICCWNPTKEWLIHGVRELDLISWSPKCKMIARDIQIILTIRRFVHDTIQISYHHDREKKGNVAL